MSNMRHALLILLVAVIGAGCASVSETQPATNSKSKMFKDYDRMLSNASVIVVVNGTKSFRYYDQGRDELRYYVTIESLTKYLTEVNDKRIAIVYRRDNMGTVENDNKVIKLLIDHGFKMIIISPLSSWGVCIESVIRDGVWKEGTCMDFDPSMLEPIELPPRTQAIKGKNEDDFMPEFMELPPVHPPTKNENKSTPYKLRSNL